MRSRSKRLALLLASLVVLLGLSGCTAYNGLVETRQLTAQKLRDKTLPGLPTDGYYNCSIESYYGTDANIREIAPELQKIMIIRKQDLWRLEVSCSVAELHLDLTQAELDVPNNIAIDEARLQGAVRGWTPVKRLLYFYTRDPESPVWELVETVLVAAPPDWELRRLNVGEDVSEPFSHTDEDANEYSVEKGVSR